MNYKWDAEEYSKNSGNQKRWADGLLKQIDFKGNEIVLDIGCGDGKITALIREKTPRGVVLGIDSSKDMIGLAKGRYDGKYKNMSFKKADACGLGFKNRFDIVFSNASFHWISDHNSLLKCIYQSLRPGGNLFVQMGAKGNFCDIVATGNKLIRRKKWRKYFKNFIFPYNFFAASAYRKLLRKYGFKINTIHTFSQYMEYDEKEKFKKSLSTIWMPYMCKAPSGLRGQFLDETVEQYLKDYPPNKNGWIRVKMNRLEFQAQKIVSENGK
ncbi:MAG: methyltransferase domain-containing protein [Sedimentisphaerales bacterium]|jgi:trans-aconitate methyltransferase